MSIERRGRFHGRLVACVAISLFLVPMLLRPLALQAQQPAASGSTLQGRVLLEGSPVPSVPVILHRVTPDESGEVGATVTGLDGEFEFPVEAVEGAEFTVYFPTSDFRGVRYFGPPVHAGIATEEAYVLAVFDTTSVLPEPIRVSRRDMILVPERGGAWEVNEVVRLVNPNNLSLVPRSGAPTWALRIPDFATDFEAGDADILSSEMALVGDQVTLLSAIPPGGRQMLVRYRLPPGETDWTVPFAEATDTFTVFVQQPSHLSAVIGAESTRLIESEGEQFLQYSATALQPGATVELRWTRGDGPPVDPVLAAVSVTVLLLGVGLWAAVRNRPLARPA